MTEAEWDQLAIQLQARWPAKPIAEESIDLWYFDLADQPSEAVEAAIGALYRDGREWVPNGAQIRNKIIDLQAEASDWSAAYELALEAVTSHGGYEYGGMTWLREQDPIAADVAHAYGWRDFCRSETTSDGTRRAHFRDMYNLRATKAIERERYRGLPSGGLKVIENANKPTKLGDLITIEAPE